MQLKTGEGIARQILVTASIGVSVQLACGVKPWEEQLSAADQALYRVKGTGRNRVEMMFF